VSSMRTAPRTVVTRGVDTWPLETPDINFDTNSGILVCFGLASNRRRKTNPVSMTQTNQPMYEVKNNRLFETTSRYRYSVHNISVDRTPFDSTFDIEPQQPEYGQISLQKRMVSILYQPEFDKTDHRVPSLTCRARHVKCELAPLECELV
jgi:hypothetical protein